jgi:hypothetical protein
LEQPFRGGYLTIWQGANLLVHHLDERASLQRSSAPH